MALFQYLHQRNNKPADHPSLPIVSLTIDAYILNWPEDINGGGIEPPGRLF